MSGSLGAAGILTNKTANPQRPVVPLSLVSNVPSGIRPTGKPGTNAVAAKTVTNAPGSTPVGAPAKESFFSTLLSKLGFGSAKTAAPTNAAVAKTNAAVAAKAPGAGSVSSKPGGESGSGKTATNIVIAASASTKPEAATNALPSVSGDSGASNSVVDVPPPSTSPLTNAPVAAKEPALPAASLSNAPAPSVVSEAPVSGVVPPTEASTNALRVGTRPVFVSNPVLASTNGITIARSKVLKSVKAARTGKGTNAAASALDAPVKKP